MQYLVSCFGNSVIFDLTPDGATPLHFAACESHCSMLHPQPSNPGFHIQTVKFPPPPNLSTAMKVTLLSLSHAFSHNYTELCGSQCVHDVPTNQCSDTTFHDLA